ncbi:hypothetical protein BGZ72_009590 [Mortierella alpina]|nr:hypothetical protein BGZ72_009590 [Mortierella alpina]
MVAAQDAPETQSMDAVEDAGSSDIIVIQSDDSSVADDEDGENNEASAAALAADNATYNHKLCPLWGKTALIMDQNYFCLFLPVRGQPVVSALQGKFVAGPACTPELSRVLGTETLPYDFIQSSNVVKDARKKWVQVSGRIDPAQYDFSKKDQGAAYHHGIAKGATCLGYSHFIQFIEPNTKTYCLRCCENKKDCPVEKSREGCKAAFGKSVKL